ncbi:E3 ubiquitin-protein ligase SH3RF1-like [Tachypleus tridentatus]|uniref:E3 ubiquitin-protein ligase SH3RF1-like n=1 Tax=Tachypleus tridentatus TaxID=6853 RepID=UPI003FD6B36C
MDETFLNDILECSVCLEQLDTSSKVLPCQHTFCRRCLEEIVNSHKELRCPECRVLVDTKVEDLPCNILLIRLLEGIKNNSRFTRNSNTGNDTLGPKVVQPIPCAKALYPYEAKEPGDLSFKKGDIIVLRKRIDQNWYSGEVGGKHGFFPASYVQVLIPIPVAFPQCKALYDFRLSTECDEKDCLIFSKGEIITVIRRVDENWAEGKLGDRIGIFPISFVEMNSAARALMKLSSNLQGGPSRIAPPIPISKGAQVSGQPVTTSGWLTAIYVSRSLASVTGPIIKLCIPELENIKEEKELDNYLEDLPEVKQLYDLRHQLVQQNEELACENLGKKPIIEEHKKELLEKLEEFQSLRKEFDDASQMFDMFADAYTPSTLRVRLGVATLQAEEESDKVAEMFLSSSTLELWDISG